MSGNKKKWVDWKKWMEKLGTLSSKQTPQMSNCWWCKFWMVFQMNSELIPLISAWFPGRLLTGFPWWLSFADAAFCQELCDLLSKKFKIASSKLEEFDNLLEKVQEKSDDKPV